MQISKLLAGKKTILTFNIYGWIIYYGSLGLMLLLLALHGGIAHRADWPVFGTYVPYDHVGNFIGSFILLEGISLFWILDKVSWIYILSAAFAICFANFIYEYLLTFLNTKDPQDALAGVVGVIFGLAILRLIQNIGVRPYHKAS